jgi:hypothetical protein
MKAGSPLQNIAKHARNTCEKGRRNREKIPDMCGDAVVCKKILHEEHISESQHAMLIILLS